MGISFAQANPGWFKQNYSDDKEWGFYCQGKGDTEEKALAEARTQCASNMCMLFGVEVESSVVVKETLTDTSVTQTIIEKCPDVRLIGREEKRKSTDCFEGICTAYIFQTYAQAEFQKEQERLDSPGIHPDLLVLLNQAKDIPLKAPPTGKLQITTPWIDADGKEIKRLAIFIDGDKVKGCNRIDMFDEDICLNNHELSAGPHFLTLIYSTDDWNIKYQTNNRIHIPQDAIAQVDSKWLLQEAEPGIMLGTYQQATETCGDSLLSLATTPACDVSDLEFTQERIDLAIKQCSTDQLNRPSAAWVSSVLHLTKDNLFNLSSSRCYGSFVSESPLSILTGNSDVKDFWPSTMKSADSTWSWIQDMDFRINDTNDWLIDLQNLSELIKQRIERTQVFDDLVIAMTEQAKLSKEARQTKPRKPLTIGPTLENLYKLGMKQPFTLDPREVQGHRNYYLIHDVYTYRFPVDHAFSKQLAIYINENKQLHCNNYSYAHHIRKYFMRDNELMPHEWVAVQTMIRNTPDGKSLYGCKEFFNGRLESVVSRKERLIWLAKEDCARSPVNESATLKSYMNINSTSNRHRIDEETKQQLKSLVPNCQIERIKKKPAAGMLNVVGEWFEYEDYEINQIEAWVGTSIGRCNKRNDEICYLDKKLKSGSYEIKWRLAGKLLPREHCQEISPSASADCQPKSQTTHWLFKDEITIETDQEVIFDINQRTLEKN